MINTLKYYKFWFFLSGLAVVISLVSLSLWGLRLGIDFKGGELIQLQFNSSPNLTAVNNLLTNEKIGGFQVQTAGTNSLLIETQTLSMAQQTKVLNDITSQIGTYTQSELESIGPTIGSQLKQDAIYELVMVSLAIVLYIGYAFRKVAKPVTSWRFGISTVVALLHDLIIVLGIFSLLGHFEGVEVDSLFVTAMLTVLGFSVHDTIVVFDRIRENLRVYPGQSIDYVVNHSISQTLVRSLNTSLTVLFVLLSLLLFGGETIHYFVLALFVGIIVGTYSSIFIASPFLVFWQKWRTKQA